MEFESFEKEFFYELSNNKKNCLKRLDNNKDIIETYLGESGDYNTLKRFTEKLNDIIIRQNDNGLFQKKYSLFEKVFEHPSFKRVYRFWKNSEGLIKTCQKRNFDAFKWMLKMKIDPCVQDENGMTALMFAVKDRTLESFVRELVNCKDALDIVDNDGNNALFHAIKNVKSLNLLIFSKININNVNKNNETVLLHCCKNKIYEPLKYLTVSKDLNVNIPDNEDWTAGMYLAEEGQYHEFTILNRCHCNYNYINRKGEFILSIVINKLYHSNINVDFVRDYIRIISFLSKTDCDFNVPIDKDGNTIILYSMKF